MNSDWLNIDVLEDYLDGKLEAKEMHFIERMELDDPFIAEALEGLRQSPKRKQQLSLLQKQLHDRIAHEPIKRKLFGLTSHRLSIAATAAVVFISVSTLFYLREVNRRAAIAKHKAQGVVVDLDTSTAIANTKPIVTEKPAETPQTSPIKQPTKEEKIEQVIASARKDALAKNEHVADKEAQQINLQAAEKMELKVATPNPAAPIPQAFVSGKVISQNDAQPIAGAVVRATGTTNAATTDANGNFSISLDTTKVKSLSIGYIGYQNAIAAIDTKNNLNISLKENENSLNEVVVTRSKAKSLKKAPDVSEMATINNGKVNYFGNVVDQYGHPIQGATVKVAGTSNVTKTDNQGNFALPVNNSTQNKPIEINADGFKDLTIQGAPNPTVIREALNGNKTINEIAAITGSNGRSKDPIHATKIILRSVEDLDKKSAKEITEPTPNATVDYTKYLRYNNKLYKGTNPAHYVRLSFKVSSNGRPQRVKIVKSLNKEADAEAKRLVENGPDWVLPKNGNNQAFLNIAF
ncbi:carboxypeptidase-like regulatory domain-containing protein [Pedobacter sp. MW01-1-1]|uniref:carboxypeptidase-like regulatory domain-containing protein n=1 Tax=Pedobacter sp. MW01-1-1 TaxID=3383027 RepID=UPI003FEDBA43